MELMENIDGDVFKQTAGFNLFDTFTAQALGNLHNNTSQVELNGHAYNVIRPGELYPGVWGWDAAFHAIGLAHESGLRGLEELEVSALGQAEDGRIPSILFYDAEEARQTYYPSPDIWQDKSAQGLDISGISQPPVFGSALERVLEIDPSCKAECEDRIRNLFEVAFNYQKWWYEERDPEENGLVVTIHPWETGRDNAVEWDPMLERVQNTDAYKNMDFDPSVRMDNRHSVDASHRPTDANYKMFTYLLQNVKKTGYTIKDENGEYRNDLPFCVQDIGIISLLQSSNESLLKLCGKYGTDEQKQQLQEWSNLTCNSVRNTLWNEAERSFQSRDVHTGDLTQITNGSYMALATQIPTEDQALVMTGVLDEWKAGVKKANGDDFTVKFNIPSTAPNHPDFESQRYWRGPSWTIVNYVVTEGMFAQAERFQNLKLYEKGLQIMQQTLDVIQKDGEFYEYHDPHTGEGCGAKDFGFTSVAFLELGSKLTKFQEEIEQGVDFKPN